MIGFASKRNLLADKKRQNALYQVHKDKNMSTSSVRRPSHGYGMPAVSEDPTDRSESTDSFFKPRKHDIVPIVLALLSIIACLTAGLTSFFVVGKNQYQESVSGLDVVLNSTLTQYSTALKSTSVVIDAVASFFQLSKTNVTLYDQFDPYMKLFMDGTSGSMGAYMTYITYSNIVPYENTKSFLDYAHSLGGDYKNLTITGRDALGRIVPVNYTGPTRDIIMQTVPTTYMRFLVGYDRASDPTKTDTRNRAIASGVTCVSGRSTIVGRTDQQVGATFMKAIYNRTTGEATGLISSVVTMSQLTDTALESLTSLVTVSITDMNATDDSFGGFFYSTAPSGNESVISVAANKAMIDSAPFTSIGYVKFADRVLKITVIPSDAYIGLYNTYIKWVALVLCLCFMMVLLVVCVFIYFLRKLMVARKGRLNAELQIDLLRTNQSSLRSLLERIATQEQKQRSTINAFPDYVCVVSDSGKLLQTNAAFDADFPFSQMELERGVYTFAIFTELASDFYRTAGENEIITQAARRFGDYMDVKVRVRSLGHDSNKDSSSLSNEFKSKTGPTSNLSSSSVQVIEEEAYLIIAKNITEKKEDSIVDERARHARSELEKKFRDPKFRSELRAFCEREKNVENVLFLEAVREYKKTPFAERVNMKDSIFEKFIKRGAMLQLNLANDVIVEETIKISKCIADVDVFKTVEECVFKTLEDVYPRFQMERKSSTASTASLSSSE